MIHALLRHDNNLKDDLLNLHALENHLPAHMREDFLNLSTHTPLLG